MRTFVELPPRYAAWQAAAGLPRVPDAPSLLTLPALARLRPGAAAGATERAGAGSELGSRLGVSSGSGAAPDQAAVWPPGGRVVLAGGPVRLRITSPENGAHLLRDPETPADLNTVALRAVVDPAVDEVVWYVDGMPLATAAYPYTARWRLQPGEHRFQVRLGSGGSVSRPVQVTVD